jgi:cobalt-zinc-cadmium resistance protein CzcA
MRNRIAILASTTTLALASVFLFLRLGSDFIPQLDEGDLVAGLVRDTSISLDQSVSAQLKAEAIIREFDEVEKVFSRIGTPESATDPMGVNFSDTFIILKKKHQQWPVVDVEGEKRRRSKRELMEAISDRIEKELPGHEVSPTQPISMRFNEILEGSRADVALRIFGPDLDKLINYIDQSKKIIEEVPGVAEAEMDSLTALKKSPVMNVDLDYNSMAKIGVSLQTANSTLMMAMGGIQVGNFYELDRRFPVVLHLAEELREKPDEISKIPVGLPDGGSIPLRTIASFNVTDQVTTIARSFGKRYAALAIFLQDRDVGSFVSEAKAKIEKMNLEPGYRIEWGGQFKNLERARLRLLFIIPITLLVIFLLLLRDIGDLKLTLLVYGCIPLALTGGVLSLVARGIPFSISAAVGFIALLGIAILNGMVLVDFINQLRSKGEAIRDAVLTGARARLRPVVMTALVAGLGFIPMAFNSGLGAEVQRPLATVVIGGIVSSTILTLILLPTLYLWLKGGESNV